VQPSPSLRESLGIVSDVRVVRRALLTSLLVGLILTAVHVGVGGPTTVIEVILTFLVPFVVSLVSSWAVIRRTRTDTALLEREIHTINRFPDQNPHPVMRIAGDGSLSYANAASEPLLTALSLEIGAPIPSRLRSELLAAAGDPTADPIEVMSGVRTFQLLAVDVPDLGVVNVYGTDVTAAKVIDRFPNRNPNPVFRVSREGTLIYANDASSPIVRSLGVGLGDPLPASLIADVRSIVSGLVTGVEIRAEERTYRLEAVDIPEFDFVNVYGTDVTAAKWITKFPDQNPNPVLRIALDRSLVYANDASEFVLKGFGVEVGEEVPATVFTQLKAIADAGVAETVEVESDGHVVALLPVWIPDFGFINVYGTDVTAVRELETAHRENERLLLNILPPSIAARLRAGEATIADGFEEMTVLFADVVGFTELSSRLEPHQVVDMLNTVFSTFDGLVDRFGLEKIKTIGDAYMVVGGLGADDADHAVQVTQLGLQMLEEVRRFTDPEPIQLRIGIHTGPAVAGVIGLKKFIYDVWGDTVNMASRLEGAGVPGRIQVGRQTYERLFDSFGFEARGEIELKGKGLVETFLVTAPRKLAPHGRAAPR
jgi:class 3 adenylate cyclase